MPRCRTVCRISCTFGGSTAAKTGHAGGAARTLARRAAMTFCDYTTSHHITLHNAREAAACAWHRLPPCAAPDHRRCPRRRCRRTVFVSDAERKSGTKWAQNRERSESCESSQLSANTYTYTYAYANIALTFTLTYANLRLRLLTLTLTYSYTLCARIWVKVKLTRSRLLRGKRRRHLTKSITIDVVG